jgi:uncharacterized Tic20 family protein
MLAHLSALVGLLGLPSLLGPLIVWLAKREEDPYIDDQGKEALNFNISVLIYLAGASVVAVMLTVLTFGIGIFLLLPVLIPVLIGAMVGWVVLVVIAAIKTSNGEPYRYPATIRLVT